MSLPFLKPKAVVGLIISHRKSDGSTEATHSEGNEDEGLDSCSDELMRAFKSGDTKGVSAALRAAFEILASSEPADEDDESFDAMNELAATKE